MGFDEFRRKLELWGQQQLKAERPAYVSALKAQIAAQPTDLESARGNALAFAGKPLSWTCLLTQCLDVELARDRVKLAASLCGETPPGSDVVPGAWVVYHMDAWYLAAAGLLERIEKLMIAGCRKLIKEKAHRDATSRTLKLAIRKRRDQIKSLRDAVAHGGGYVEELDSLRLWEVHLALGFDGFSEIVDAFHGRCEGYQAKWHVMVSTVTSQLILESDSWFDQLAEDALPEAPTSSH